MIEFFLPIIIGVIAGSVLAAISVSTANQMSNLTKEGLYDYEKTKIKDKIQSKLFWLCLVAVMYSSAMAAYLIIPDEKKISTLEEKVTTLETKLQAAENTINLSDAVAEENTTL